MHLHLWAGNGVETSRVMCFMQLKILIPLQAHALLELFLSMCCKFGLNDIQSFSTVSQLYHINLRAQFRKIVFFVTV